MCYNDAMDIVQRNDNADIITLMDEAEKSFGNDNMIAALPYLFSGQRPKQVAKALLATTGEVIAPSTISSWMQNSDYARVVSAGRSLTRAWHLNRLMQLSTLSLDLIERELVESDDTKLRIDAAKFMVREQGRTTPVEVRHSFDQPALAIAVTSAAIIADRVAKVLAGESTSDDRGSILGQYTVLDRDDMDSVDNSSGIQPTMGVLNVDWPKGAIQCHVCAGFYANLYSHMAEAHKVDTSEYRAAYGIADDIPLMFSRLSEECSDKIARRNWRGESMFVLDEERNLAPYGSKVSTPDS